MDIIQSIPFDISSIKSGGIGTFWAQEIELKELMKFIEIYVFRNFSTLNK